MNVVMGMTILLVAACALGIAALAMVVDILSKIKDDYLNESEENLEEWWR